MHPRPVIPSAAGEAKDRLGREGVQADGSVAYLLLEEFLAQSFVI